MKILFFFVHPSKFHVFKHTINDIISKGHQVEILITGKDVLEDLVKAHGWKYVNIFPGGRKIKGIHPYLSAAINTIRTVVRLFRYIRTKKFDLFVTDDLLTIPGKILGVPSVVITDDDLRAVPEFSFILLFADHIIAPEETDLGIFNKKKIPFYSYKELAYLHPDVFIPNENVVRKFNPDMQKYFLIRLVSLKATHDVNKKGISNEKISELISILEPYGKVFLSSERELPYEFEKYRLKINVEDIAHAIAYADLFIGDSQTMNTEAAVLGTPFIRYNDFVGKISVMDVKENKYGLGFGYTTDNFDAVLVKIKEILSVANYKNQHQEKRNKFLKEKINLTKFITFLILNYPSSVKKLKENPSYQFNL